MRGLSEANGSWNTICIERRCGRNSALPRWVISLPFSLMLPLVGSTSRSTLRATVDLPQPDSPTSPSVSPDAKREADAVDGMHRADPTAQDAAAHRRSA